MKIALLALLWGIVFYIVGLFGTVWLLPQFSRNTHDASIEAAMTGAFVCGPLFAVIGLIAGFLFHRSRRKGAN